MMVYPFYIYTNAEGRKSPIAGGTRKKDGYMETTIFQRDQGEITNPFKIVQRSVEELNKETQKMERILCTEVYYQGELIKEHTTKY